MIERYQDRFFKNIFSLKSRYQTFLKVELAAIEYYYKKSLIDDKTFKKCQDLKVDVKRIGEIEAITKHDVNAFIDSMLEQLDTDFKYFHLGLTSSDIIDTSLSLILKSVNDKILTALDELLKTTLKQAHIYKYHEILARTHGRAAEITTIGIKLLNFYEDLKRARRLLINARSEIEVIKIGGPIGIFSTVDTELAKYVSLKFKLREAKIFTQVLPRDIYSQYFSSLAQISVVCDKMAVNIRLSSISEVNEICEGFSNMQKGSSAMPHKKNPVLSENISGLNRLVLGYLSTALLNVPLYLERDISHSSNERIILEDATSTIYFMLKRMNHIISNLFINEEQIRKNIDNTFDTVYSAKILNSLILKGKSREEAYRLIQSASLDALKNKCSIFNYISELSEDEIETIKMLDKKNINYLFNRVINE